MSMTVEYVSANKRLKVSFQGSSQKEIFKQIAEFQDIFEEDTCGHCKSGNTRFGAREIDGNWYYERVCKDCSYRLRYGQHKSNGTLFPKRKDDNDKFMKFNGWYEYKYTPPANVPEDDGFEKPKSPQKVKK